MERAKRATPGNGAALSNETTQVQNNAAQNGEQAQSVDLEMAARFLNALGAKNPTFQTFADRGDDPKLARILHGKLDEHADVLRELNQRGAGVFVAMNQTDGKGRKRENIKRIRAVAVDLDGAPIDPLLKCPVKPHIITESSPGRWHGVWKVKGLAIDNFEGVQRSIAERFDGDPQIAKTTHCLRLAGYFHNKGEPFRTHIVEVNDLPTYSAEQILAEFPPLDEPHRPPISRNNSDRILLPAGAPGEQAEIFVKTRFFEQGMATLFHYRDMFYRWASTQYREYLDVDLSSDLHKFLMKADVLKDGVRVPFNPRTSSVNEIIHALRRSMRIKDAPKPPFWILPVDGDPEGARYEEDHNQIPCLNGQLDITKRKLSGHSPAYFCTNCTGIQYDPDAPEPKRWHQFLSELWPDDPEARQTLVEIFGYLLTYSTDQQKIFLLVGPRRSGKGTIARLLSALLGQENVASPTLTDLNNEFGLAPLVDKKVAIVSDARIGGREVHKIAERLLSISGQDRKSVNRKFKDQWEEQFHVRFFVCSNELPNLADASAALPSRYVPLIIKNSFYDKEDHELISKLLREMPAILNEALQGLDRLLKRGHFLLPKSSKDALRQMEDLASPVKAFARDWCVIDADRQVETVKLYKAFVAWCDDNGHKKVNRSLFGRDLHAAYPKISRMQGRTKGARKRFYSYIDLSRVGEVQYQDFLLEKRRT